MPTDSISRRHIVAYTFELGPGHLLIRRVSFISHLLILFDPKICPHGIETFS
jgi:hypothetical protein